MIANTVTGFRVLVSIALLFCPVFSPAFYMLYLTAGLSDMIDGTIARRTNTVSEFGERFDTAADFVLSMFLTFFCVAHGLASLLANNSMEYDEAGSKKMLENVFFGMVASQKGR